MSVIFIVLPLAIIMAAAALRAFIWAVRQGQFDDLDTPALRVAMDDDAAEPACCPSSRTQSSAIVISPRPNEAEKRGTLR